MAIVYNAWFDEKKKESQRQDEEGTAIDISQLWYDVLGGQAGAWKKDMGESKTRSPDVGPGTRAARPILECILDGRHLMHLDRWRGTPYSMYDCIVVWLASSMKGALIDASVIGLLAHLSC